MAREAKVKWIGEGAVQTQATEVKVDGEVVATFDKVRFNPAEKGKMIPKTLAEASKALGFKKESNAIRALLLGRNKMNATKARAQAKLNDLD